MKKLSLILLLIGGCASKPYHYVEPTAFELAVAECKHQSMTYKTRLEANNPADGNGGWDGIANSVQARKMFNQCMSAKGWRK